MKRHAFIHALGDPLVRLALLTGIALMVQAVVAKHVLEVELDFISQYAALWVFIVFLFTGARDRVAVSGTAIAVIVVTAAVLTLHAV